MLSLPKPEHEVKSGRKRGSFIIIYLIIIYLCMTVLYDLSICCSTVTIMKLLCFVIGCGVTRERVRKQQQLCRKTLKKRSVESGGDWKHFSAAAEVRNPLFQSRVWTVESQRCSELLTRFVLVVCCSSSSCYSPPPLLSSFLGRRAAVCHSWRSSCEKEIPSASPATRPVWSENCEV